jgi:hypothetical protein
MFHQSLCCPPPLTFLQLLARLTQSVITGSFVHAVGKALITGRMVNRRVSSCALREVAIGPWVVTLDIS